MASSIERSRGKPAYRRAGAAAAVGPVNSVLPAITGTAQVGQTLTAANGTWSNTPTYARQWLRNGAPIASATGTTYVLVTGDLGATMSVRVTATNDGVRRVATSAPTAAVIAA